MTTAVLNALRLPTVSFKGFYRGFHNLFVTMGKARAAGELHRMGYVEEAKAIMLDMSAYK